jgi:hypothetical protein
MGKLFGWIDINGILPFKIVAILIIIKLGSMFGFLP